MTGMLENVEKKFITLEDIQRTGKESLFKDLEKGDLFLPYNPKYPHSLVWMKLSATMCTSITDHTPGEWGWHRNSPKNKKVERVMLKENILYVGGNSQKV